MKVVNTHRKCMTCQNVTTNLEQDKCSRGGYMHLMGFVYQPATVESEPVKAQAS